MSGDRRLAECVRNWPDAAGGDYHPSCCRFPKSCSPYPYPEQVAAGVELEPEPTPAYVTREPTGGQGLREALLIHHPIMRSETGPFSGCRCGQVGLGQDVIAHVVTELRAALDGVR